MHYLRIKKAGRLAEFTPMPRGKIRRSRIVVSDKADGICKIEDCSNPANLRGFCRTCYGRLYAMDLITTDLTERQRAANGSPVCSIEGCFGKPKHIGLCTPHYHRKLRYGDPTFLPEVTKARGKPKIDRLGYRHVYKPGHPLARQNGYVFEHRLVMSEIIGRLMLPNERVHHANGRKADNVPTNLELWVISHPAGQRVQDLVTWAKEILILYPEKLLEQLELPLSRGAGS